jgi:hypothetical protein
MDLSLLEIAIVIVIAIALFVVLFKYFKWAVGAVIIFILVLFGLYLALRVLDYSDSSGAIVGLLGEVKEKLGFNDPKTQADVTQLKDNIVETTAIDTFIQRLNLKGIWDDIKAVLSF